MGIILTVTISLILVYVTWSIIVDIPRKLEYQNKLLETIISRQNTDVEKLLFKQNQLLEEILRKLN